MQRLRSHPLYRALRVDKVILAALEATLGEHLAGVAPPALAMIGVEAAALRGVAERLAEGLGAAGVEATVVEDESYVGGGALPGQGLPTWVARIVVPHPDDAARALRLGEPAVLVRVSRGALHLDPRTVAQEERAALVARVVDVVGETK